MEKKLVIVLKLLVVFNCFMYTDALFRNKIRGNCTENEFFCDSSLCIQIEKLCNNQTDCSDGTDEIHCDCIMNGKVPCNNGTNCQPEEAICAGEVEHCEDYEVTCTELIDENTYIENSTDIFNQSSSLQCPDDQVVCNNGTTCVVTESACSGDYECEIDCDDMRNETMSAITTINGVDQDNGTEDVVTLWSISNNTLEEIIVETTTIQDIQTTTTEAKELDNDIMNVSVIISDMQSSEIKTKPTDEKNKTEEIDMTENEIPDDLLLNVVSTTSPTPGLIDDFEHTKEITKLETETSASKQTKHQNKGNATAVYESTNAASQTSTADTEENLNIIVPVCVGGVIALVLLVVVGSFCIRRKKKSASYKCDHYS